MSQASKELSKANIRKVKTVTKFFNKLKPKKRRKSDPIKRENRLDYFENDGKENRVKEERRKQGERRSGLK